MFDKYFLISYECISSIGESLDLHIMFKHFLRTVVKKTSAISAMALDKETLETIAVVNKKNFISDYKNFTIENEKNHYFTLKCSKDFHRLYVVYDSIICIIKYNKNIQDLDILGNMCVSFSKKINSSVQACDSFSQYKQVKDTLELAIEGANDGLWDWNIATNEVYFSPRWKSMLGYDEDELPNEFESWNSKIHPQDKKKTLDNLDKYLNQEIDIFENTHRLKHKNGSWIWILDRGKATFVDGKAIRMVGFHTDISKLKELEEQLAIKVLEEVEKNKEKDHMLAQQSRLAQMGEMISMIAHQWRQPLASISSVAVSIKLKIALEKYDFSNQEGIDKFLNYLETELDDVETFVDVLTNTIDDFRNFYKDEKQSIQALINEPINKALNIVKPQLEAHRVQLIENFSTKTPIKLFESELLQVFLNIFKNAIDNFIEKNTIDPMITITTEDVLDKVIITICDNGGGIDNSIIEMIFDPYFSTKSEKNGTGLGLYMSKTIIEQHHGGKLTVKNKDAGACFYIILDKK
jgi:PAS domain S-box-containing protein